MFSFLITRMVSLRGSYIRLDCEFVGHNILTLSVISFSATSMRTKLIPPLISRGLSVTIASHK